MSDSQTTSPHPANSAPRRWHWNTGGLVVAVAAIAATLMLWANSSQFQSIARTRVAAELQAATGGRVEIASFEWHLFRLEAEARGIVIHGDEGPKEAPYVRVEKLRVSLSVLGLWTPRILLRDLEVLKPEVHPIFYPDGSTNQPHPGRTKRPKSSDLNTLFNLQAGHIAIIQGLVHLDNRAASLDFQNRYLPINLTGKDIRLVTQYANASGKEPESYHVEAGITDLQFARGGASEKADSRVVGSLKTTLDLTRDALYLRALQLTAHASKMQDRTLNVVGSLQHFSQPHWQAGVTGDLDLHLLAPILGYPFAPEGVARLQLSAAGQNGQFRVDGTVHAQRTAYIGTGVIAKGIDLKARVHADPNWLRITDAVAHLQPGGDIKGEVLLQHWLPPDASPEMAAAVATSAAQRQTRKRFELKLHPTAANSQAQPAPPHSILLKKPDVDIPVNGSVNAAFEGVALDTILAMVSQPPFQRLGLDTLVSGTAHAVWIKGDVRTLSVSSQLSLSPSNQPTQSQVPASGRVDATYTQRDGSVNVGALELNLPASHLDAHGRLGAYPPTGNTNLSVNFVTRQLSEFDTVLRDLGVTRNGVAGSAALPVALGGTGEFRGTWEGSLLSPRLSGTLHASDLTAQIPTQQKGKAASETTSWNSVDATGTYDAEHIAILHGSLRRGPAQVSMDGTLTAPPGQQASGHGSEPDPLNANSVVHAHIRAEHLQPKDFSPFLDASYPITGNIDAQVTADGPLHALAGSGWVELTAATVYGEPLDSIRVEGSLTEKQLRFSSFALRGNAGAASGAGTYDLHSGRFEANAHGTNIDISKIARLHADGTAVKGSLEFAVAASGTRDAPKLEGHASAAGLSVGGQPLGTVHLKAHSVDNALVFEGNTNIETAQIAINGRTLLHGDLPTQARLDFSRFNIAALFKLANLENITAESALEGSGEVTGPLAHPADMRGDLRLPRMAVNIAGVHLKSDNSVHIGLNNAKLTLDPVHILGDDTDVRAQGAWSLRDSKKIDFAGSGSVNLKLAETLDRDLTASGTTHFQVEAHGPISNPGLRGLVEFENASLALEDIPNGLSQLRGTLVFNQNRLEVKSLTAMTGGGQLSLGGYLAYQHGIYADLTVTGKQIRIRYPEGVSSLADASLQLQGTQSSLLLSGDVLITRFSVSPDLDIAGLAAQANAVQPVAPPNAPSNHVRMNVHIQSSPQLNFQNAYAKLAGDVDLHLRGTMASPSLLGRISVTEGNAVIAGTRYELQRGDITFTNPVRIQPSIDLNATARVEDYDITLGLHGTPDKMNVSYRSDPPLPEADVVALLALGRTQSEQGLYTQQQQESAGVNPSTDVLLGGALNATVSSRVQKLFGAGSVKVDPSYLGALGNSTTRITVEEQFGRNVTLTYATNVDTSAQQLLQAEIAINRHVSVQVTRDESGVFSMVLKAIRRYR